MQKMTAYMSQEETLNYREDGAKKRVVTQNKWVSI
jgi:hypothetical protein